MKRILLLISLLILSLGCSTTDTKHLLRSKTNATNQSLIDATVALFEEHDGRYIPICSGIWVSDRHILTAQHCVTVSVLDFVNNRVIEINPELGKTVYFLTKKDIVDCNCHVITATRPGKLVFQDPEADLALIEYEAIIPKTIVNLEGSNYTYGDQIRIVGHPKGQLYSFIFGYVSNIRTKSFQVTNVQEKFVDAVQVSSFATTGNSGGGAFDKDGHLVGIASFKLSEPGYMFFIMTKDVNRFLKNAYYAQKIDVRP